MHGFDPSSWSQQLIGKVVAGRYRLDSVLGVGGMGAVYAGVHTEFGRRVAVKMLIPQFGQTQGTEVERFRREAQLAASVGKRGVVDILDFGIDDQAGPFMVMEFLEGESLEERLERDGGRIDPQEAIRIASEALKTLSAVHEQSIVHRDLKPANLFLCRAEFGEPEIKILDFGISRFTGAASQGELTAPGMILGTPRFMASEQAINPQDIDQRADLYALGLILYTCISGVQPYAEHQGYDIVRAVVLGPSTPISTLMPQLPRPLAHVIDKATLRDREHRFQSAREFYDALVAATQGVDIQSGMLHVPAVGGFHPATLGGAAPTHQESGAMTGAAGYGAAGYGAAGYAAAPTGPGGFTGAQTGVEASGFRAPPGAPLQGGESKGRGMALMFAMLSVLVLGLLAVVLVLVLRDPATVAAPEAVGTQPSGPAPGAPPSTAGDPPTEVPAELRPYQEANERGRAHLQAGRLTEASAAFDEVVEAWVSQQMRSDAGMLLVADAYIGLGDIVVAEFVAAHPSPLTTQAELTAAFQRIANRYSASMARYAEAQNADLRRASCASLHRGLAAEAAADATATITGDPQHDGNFDQTMQMLLPAYRNTIDTYQETALSMYAAAGRQPGECSQRGSERHRELTAEIRARGGQP